MKRIGLEIAALLLIVLTLWACHKEEDKKYEPYAIATPAMLKAQGVKYLDAGRQDSALICFTAAAEKYRPEMTAAEKSVCASAANNAGYIYIFSRHDYPQAYTWLLRACDIAREAGNNSTPAFAYLNISNIYFTYNDAESAAQYLKKSLESAIKSHNWPVAVIAVSNMLTLQQQCVTPPDMEKELSQFFTMDLPPTPLLENIRQRRQALQALKNGQYEDALRHTRLAREHIDTRETPEIYRWNCDGLEALILSKTGDNTAALQLLNRTSQEAARANDLATQADIAGLKADIYTALVRPDSALECLHRKQQLSDSLFQSQHYGAVYDANADYQLRKFNAKITEVETRRHRTQVALISSAIALALLLAIGIVIFIQNKRLRLSYRHLFERNQQLIAREQNAASDNVASPQPPSTCEKNDKAKKAEEHSELLNKINAVLDDPAAITTDDFSLQRLAKMVDSNYHYCSEAINAAYGKSFSTLLAERRVREACLRLCDNEQYGRFTIEAIAAGLGFKSRSNFTSIFKRITGLTPAEYRRQSQKDRQSNH